VAAIAVPAASGHRAAPNAHSARTIALKLAKTKKLGKILVSASGYTVFVFSGDGKNVDNCQTIPGCTNVWVPMTFGGKKPINPATLGVGPGLKQSLLSSVAMDANYFNTPQATYNGYPLYTNAKDVVQADTKYVGESADGGKWYALNAAGHVVK